MVLFLAVHEGASRGARSVAAKLQARMRRGGSRRIRQAGGAIEPPQDVGRAIRRG